MWYNAATNVRSHTHGRRSYSLRLFKCQITCRTRSLSLSLAPFLISLEWIYVKWCKAFTVSDVIALVLMIRTEVKLPFHKCSQFIGMTGRCRCLPLSTYLLIEFSHSHKSRMKHNWNAKRCSYIAVAHQLINKRPIYWIQRTSHSMHCYRSHCNN